MKCNNFDDILKQLEDVEKQELKAAVLAHGGLYRFEEEDRVTITFDTSDALIGASDVEICQISVNDNGELVLSGIPRGEFHEIEFDPDEAASGHLHYVTEAIPETDGVGDVSIPVTLLALDGEDSAKEALSAIRKAAAETIKSVMDEAGLEEVYAADIDNGNSPVVRPDEFDDNNTQTLDSIRLTDDGLVFCASASCDECEYYEENVPLDALVDIADWLTKNKESLVDPESEDGVADAVSDRTGSLVKSIDGTVVKRLFLFYGSLSVIQILEDDGIKSRVNKMMSQSDAFEAAKRLIADHFEKEGCDPWEYDLDLEVETYRGKDRKSVALDIEHTLDNFEATHHFEDEDGSGNAQGYTSFTL
jgi:hypothetical protein